MPAAASRGATGAAIIVPPRPGAVPSTRESRDRTDPARPTPATHRLLRPACRAGRIRGTHRRCPVIRFHYSLAPNPMKVALFLEEAGLPYEAVPVDTRKGEQFAPAFAALNPNNKVPVIEDGGATVFDSNAILLYLAEKTGRFLPREERSEERRVGKEC